MKFQNDVYPTRISRRAFIPGRSNDKVKEILNYSFHEKSDKQNHKCIRPDLSSHKVYEASSPDEKNKNSHNLNCKKYFSHEENSKKGQAVLKRDLVFDNSAGCCIPLYTRKAGCARMKLDIIDFGRAENSIGFAGIINNARPQGSTNTRIEMQRNFSQHFVGSSTNIIGDIKGDLSLKHQNTSRTSRLNISSMNFESNYCMPDKESSDKDFRKIRHSLGESCNGSHLTFQNGFLTSK